MASSDSILIVGAGPTGLALAFFLHNLGLSFRIIEKEKKRSGLSRALYIQPRTLEIFDTLGFADEIVKAGRKVLGAEFWADGKPVATLSYRDLPTFHPYLLILPQNELEAILEAKLKAKGVKIEREKELISLYMGGKKPVAVIQEADDQEELHPNFIIGCDGAHSTVRHQCGFTFNGKSYFETFSLGDLDVDSPYSEDHMHIFVRDAGSPTAIFPFAKSGKIRIILPHSASDLTSALPKEVPPTQTQLQRELDHRGLGTIKIKGHEWISNFRIHKRIASKWRKGGLFIAGDAAHIHSPLGGQGLNTGIQDVWNLAWKLGFVIKHGARDSLLDTYQKERHYVGKQILSLTDHMTLLAIPKYTWLSKARNWILRNIVSKPYVARKMALRLSQIAFNYPSSFLTQKDYFQDGGPPAGLRAPNAELEGATLYKKLSTKCFTCLIFTGLDKNPISIHKALALKERLIDTKLIKPLIISPEGHIDSAVVKDSQCLCHKAYGAKGPRITLIRPDGYISLQHDKIEYGPIESLMQSLI